MNQLAEVIDQLVRPLDQQRWDGSPWILTGSAMLERFPQHKIDIQTSTVGSKVTCQVSEYSHLEFERIR